MVEAQPTPKAAKRIAPGVIRAGEVYTEREFRARTGVGRNALPRLERKGLRVLRLEKKVFIAGKDWMRFLLTQADKEVPLYGCCQRND